MSKETCSQKFTLTELLLADELLFPADYERLLRKHSDISDLEVKIRTHRYAVYQSSLFVLLKSIPRSNKQELNLLETIMADLISKK